MKILILMSVLFSLNAFALSGRGVWSQLNDAGKANMILEYQKFFSELPVEETESFDVKTTSFLKFFMNDAWAAGSYDCVYAGWPSNRVGGLCSSPKKHNSSYNQGSCGANQMQCQPLLFGKGLCVPVGTKQQRSLAYSNCDKKKSKSPTDILAEIKADGKESDLHDLMDLADQICSSGKQAGTGMCNRLTSTIKALRQVAPARQPAASQEPVVVVEEKPIVGEQRGPQESLRVIPEVEINRSPETETREVVTQVNTVQRAAEEAGTPNQVDCVDPANGTPFDREVPRPLEFDGMSSGYGNGSWRDFFIKSKGDATPRPHSFMITRNDGNKERNWNYVSEDGAKSETYLWMTDEVGSQMTSRLQETLVVLLPRKMKPTVAFDGDNMVVTLPTGEKVIYDKNTKEIKSGAFSENAFAEGGKPANYVGSGISIQINHRGEDPRLRAQNATVTQNGKTCTVPRVDLWPGNRQNENTDFKYKDDQELLRYLNQKCGNKFSL